MSRAVSIDFSISSGRERARLEQGIVTQRKTCLWCVTGAFAGLGGRVGCSVCHLSCVLGLHEATLCSLCLSKRKVFREGTLCHLGCCDTRAPWGPSLHSDTGGTHSSRSHCRESFSLQSPVGGCWEKETFFRNTLRSAEYKEHFASFFPHQCFCRGQWNCT